MRVWSLRILSALMLFLMLFYTTDQVKRSIRHYRDVTTNHRQEFALWAQENLPHDAVLLADRYGRFPNPDHRRLRDAEPLFPQTVRYLARDPASLSAQEVREAGITHLLFTEQAIGQNYKKLARKDDEKLGEDELKRKRFYEKVLDQERLWEQRFEGKHHLYSSRLFLVELPPEAMKELK